MNKQTPNSTPPLIPSKHDANHWLGSLTLGFEKRDNKTALTQRKHYGPLTIQRPFYPEGEVCHGYILHPPGGVVGSDRLALNASVSPQAHALLTTPGATKFYRSNGSLALQNQHFMVDNGCLEWLPQENIFFPQCHAALHTHIHLSQEAQYMGWEVQCLGRPANQEPFGSGQLNFKTTLYHDDKLVFIDNFQAKSSQDLSAASGLRGHPVFGTFIITPAPQEALTASRELCAQPLQHGHAGVTRVNGIIIARYLGDSTAEAQQLFRNIWHNIRPFINQRPAISPRIWAT